MLSPALEEQAVEHCVEWLVDHEAPEYAFSAASLPDQPLQVILERARAALPHPFIRATTVGALRDRGYEVRLTDEPTAHVDVVLPSAHIGLPNSGGLSDRLEIHWEMLRSIFGPPEDNPVRRPKGGKA